MIWSSENLSNALNLTIPTAFSGNRIQFNSNDVEPSDIFIALPGAKTDGHVYVQDAIKKGAVCAIISQNLDIENSILVPDTLVALAALARYKRSRSSAKFIAITGSVGKTSTKEIIHLMLKPFGKVFSSRKNFNNTLGLNINLASMPDDTDFAVIELGMNHAGEMRELAQMVQPDVAIITAISEAHLEFFYSIDDIARAKCEIFEGLSKDGIAIINKDTKCVNIIFEVLQNLGLSNVYTFSAFDENNTVRAIKDCNLASYESDHGNLSYKIDSEILKISLSGTSLHQAKNFAAGLMLIQILGCDLNQALNQLHFFKVMEGRGNKIVCFKNGKHYTLICDYYNSSPESLKASLLYLKQLHCNRKVLIMGDMKELGDRADILHQEMVHYIIESGATLIFLVGSHVQCIEAKLNAFPYLVVKVFQDVETLITQIENYVCDGDMILIKGSNSMRLKLVSQYLENS